MSRMRIKARAGLETCGGNGMALRAATTAASVAPMSGSRCTMGGSPTMNEYSVTPSDHSCEVQRTAEGGKRAVVVVGVGG